MKRKIINILLGAFVIVIFCVAAFYGYKYYTLKELEKKEKHISEIWSSIYRMSFDRLQIMEKFSDTSACDITQIKNEIERNKKNRKMDNVEQLWDLEYLTNKEYLKIERCLHENIKDSKTFDSLNLRNKKLNEIIDDYNSSVLDFNKVCSVFPNFLFVKKKGFDKKKFFNLKYGENNEGYYYQKKKTEHWIETGQWE